MGAGNQQERLDAMWIVGFVDGEGCFHVGINRQPRMSNGWQIVPEFRVVQHRKDRQVLENLKEYFNFGSVGVNNGDRMEFRVRGIENLAKLVQFFKKNQLRTRKKRDFERFSEVIDLMIHGKHLSSEGLREIAELALSMNRRRNKSASIILRDCTPDAN